MYQPSGFKQQECSVNLNVIEEAFSDINTNAIELTRLLSEFNENSKRLDAQNILVKANILIGYMIAVRNQLLIYKRQGGLSATAVAKDYLSELKVQMDGLKAITYSYGSIYSAFGETQNLENKMK